MALISDKMIAKLNFRIAQEEMSSRIYLAMSMWLEWNGYSGAAKLWKRYSDEELTHAKMAYDYLLDLNIKPTVPQLMQPQEDFKSLPQIIALSYKHEVEITNQCSELTKFAMSESDMMTFGLAQKYVAEQVEELAKTQYWIDRLEIFGDDKIALRMLDEEMGG